MQKGTHTNLQVFDKPVNPSEEKILEAANENQPGDLLMGAGAIAKHLGINARQVYRLVYADEIPSFKLGGSVAARRSTLARWLDEQESAARAAA